MNIIIFILTLGLLVLVHELGHFLAAKKNGVKVDEFGFGLPPRLFGIKKGETIYSINLLPIGGFVKLYGEELHEIKNNKLKDRAFVNKTPWQKAMIISAGVIGNFILGWLLLSFLFTQGVPVPAKKVIIEKVAVNSPAEKIGLKPGDAIVSIADQNLENTQDLITLSKKFADKKIKIVIERDNQKINKEIIPRKNPPPGQGPLGVVITNYIEKKYPWYLAPFYGLKEAFNITFTIASQIIKFLFEFITLQKPNVDVAGPVGIAQYASSAIKFGKNAYLELLALLSFNLAIINILPFPALDGGRLLFVLYEAITKKKPNKKFERYTNFIGLLILLGLSLLITINDIAKILNK